MNNYVVRKHYGHCKKYIIAKLSKAYLLKKKQKNRIRIYNLTRKRMQQPRRAAKQKSKKATQAP